MSKRFLKFTFAAAAVCLQASVFAASSPKLALKGYDVVAYFSASKPLKGLAEFEYVWNDQIWRFANQANLDSFKVAPAKYAPQYGANCAWAVAHNYTAPVDPEAWEIVNGKLYLNYNKEVRAKWREKQEEYIVNADKNWPGLLAKEKKKNE